MLGLIGPCCVVSMCLFYHCPTPPTPYKLFHLCFSPTGYKLGFPQPRFWVQLIFWSNTQNSGKHTLMFISLFYTKYYNDTEDEMYRVRDGRRDTKFPYPVWVQYSPGTSMCSTIWNLSKPCPFGLFFWRLHCLGMIEACTAMSKCEWTKRMWSNAYRLGGEAQVRPACFSILGLSV